MVENAIYHGIKDRRGGGLITVTGREDGGFLCFCVQDTGRGMTPDQLRDVRARMRGELPPAYAPYANAGTALASTTWTGASACITIRRRGSASKAGRRAPA